MKKIVILFLISFPLIVHSQNVGIGTTTPTEKFEVKNPLRSTLKISSGNFSDTTELLLSNINALSLGTSFSIKNIMEEGLFFSSLSDIPANTNSNSLVIRPNGNVGIGIVPTSKLHVNGTTSINGLVRLEGLNLFEFGAGIAGKELNAGKVGYNAFGQNALTFVGAGTNATNRAVYFFAEGGTTINGPLNIEGTVKVNNNPGTVGQILTSNGTADPTWENAAYSNNIRFSFNLTQMGVAASDSLNFNGTPPNYNLNPGMVSVVPGNNARIVINKTGLYHFSGSISMTTNNISPDVSNGPTFTVGYWINNKSFSIESAPSIAIIGFVPDDDFVKTFQFSFDVYITAGQTIKFTRFAFSFGGSQSTTGHVNGYLIAD